MERKELGDTVNGSAARALDDSGETVISPRFDRKSVQRARPAVPLAEVSNRRGQRMPTALIVVVAILAGGVIGVIATALHQRSRTDSPASTSVRQTTNTASDATVGQPTSSTTGDTASGAAGDARGSEAAGESEPSRASNGTDASVATAQPTTSDDPKGEGTTDAHAALRGALDGWLAATNRRDIQKQMEYYNPTVSAFYLTRNVSREAVRAEKARVFGRASSIDVRADAPQITIGRDGRTATMRFRKHYSIEGGADARRGAVVQELRWRRTDDGWKIISERDLEVIQDK